MDEANTPSQGTVVIAGLETLQLHGVKSLREAVIDTLREGIVSGQLRPGQHLKERELAAALHVSTTPIKEALRILENTGLVRTIPRKGTFVSLKVDDALSEICVMRATLEGLAARWAAVKATDRHLAALKNHLQAMKALTEENDISALVEANTVFHNLVLDAARNAMLTQTLANVSSVDRAFRRRALQYAEEVHGGYQEHLAVYEAIASHHPDQAESRMRHHILRTAEHVLTADAEISGEEGLA